MFERLRSQGTVRCAVATLMAWLWCGSALGQGLPARQSGDAPRALPANEVKRLDEVGVIEHLGKSVAQPWKFENQRGEAVELRDYFDGERPVVLTFAYFTCPMLCGMLLRAVAESFGKMEAGALGKDFRAVTISIDPDDTASNAKAKRAETLASMGGSRAANESADWDFLTGSPEAIEAAAEKVGFSYRYDPVQGQYAHTSVAVIVSPTGKISRYFYGLQFPPSDLRFAMLEAKDGKTLSTKEKLILYCYRYDTKSGKYVLLAERIMKLGGAATVVILASLMSFWFWRERKKRHAAA